MSLKRNVVANFFGRAYSMGSVYLFVPFYIAALGIERYGIVAFYSILLTIGSLADVGLSITLSREAARESDRANLYKLLVTIERIVLAAALVFGIAVVLLADVVARHWLDNSNSIAQSEVASSLRLMALMIAPQLGVSLYTAGLMGLQRQGAANMIQAVFTTVRGGLLIPLLAYYPTLEFFFTWQLVTTVIAFALARGVLLRALGIRILDFGRASWALLRPRLRFAGGMFAITALAGVNTQMDKLFVSSMFPIQEFGYYSLASTLAQLPAALVSPLLAALFPRLTELVATGEEGDAKRIFDRMSEILATVAGASALGLFFFAPEVFSLWLGNAEVPRVAVDALRCLSLGGLLLALGSTPFYLGLAHGHTKTSIVTSSLMLIVTGPLLILGARQFGLLGAAIPWLILNGVSLIAMVVLVLPRYYGSQTRGWVIHALVTPVMICAMFLGGARLLADLVHAGTWLACALAGVGALIAIAINGRRIVMDSPLRLRPPHP